MQWLNGAEIQNSQNKSNKFNYKGHFRNDQEFFSSWNPERNFE